MCVVTYEKVGDCSQFGGAEHAQYDQYVARDHQEVDEHQNDHGHDDRGVVQLVREELTQVLRKVAGIAQSPVEWCLLHNAWLVLVVGNSGIGELTCHGRTMQSDT